jgi:peptidoglycan hydrolase-like protein with peptidoglycan-binding domain
VEKWNTTAGGGFTAAGRGGGITGKGAHILIVDDPIKDQEEADSVLVRDKLWDWYQSTAYTRLAPGGGVLVIQTWWNDDDLAGRLQNAMALIGKEDAPEGIDEFELIKYPALSEAWEIRDENTFEIIRLSEPPTALEPHQTLLRPKDFCLHEDRYPTASLTAHRALVREVSEYWAQYLLGGLVVDGAWGKKTQARCREWQKEHGLAETGELDEATRRALFTP